ncbi:MAG: hypothetical protein AAF495_00075 [Pseudomonadota bacterium]
MTPERNIEEVLRLAIRLGNRRPPYRIDLERLVQDADYRRAMTRAAGGPELRVV